MKILRILALYLILVQSAFAFNTDTFYLCLLDNSKVTIPIYIDKDSISLQYNHTNYLEFKQHGDGYYNDKVIIHKIGNTLELRGYNPETEKLTLKKRVLSCTPM